MKIDLHKILRNRIGGARGRLIPGFMISALERFVHQDEMNDILRATDSHTGSAFAAKVYDHLDLTITASGEENIPGSGRFIFASNHPLGGLDGIGLIKILGERYGDDNIRFLVNDMLMHIEPLRTVFLPINKYGAQGREAARAINDNYASDRQILIFPAGLVSRLHADGHIADLAWQKSFIQKAVAYERDIIPVHFEGLNRSRFYRTAMWRKRLGLKLNIEQTMLPAELCAARGNRYHVSFGRPISWREISRRLEHGESPLSIAAEIHDLCNTPIHDNKA